MPAVLVALGLAIGCTRPETTLKREPVQVLQLTFKDGPDPAMEPAFSEALRLPLASAADSSPEPRTLHLEIRTRPNPFEGHGWFRYALWDSGLGSLFGLQVGVIGFNLRFCAYATGAGLLAGVACSPFHYQADRRFRMAKGYLPWVIDGKWYVSGPGKSRPSGELPILDFRDLLPVLPPDARTEADIRRESLRGYAKALGTHWHKP